MSVSLPEFTSSIVDEGFSPEDTETKKLYKEVAAFAKQGQPIVIFGPTGAGKEFLSRHYYKILINTEFYQQYKDNWPSKYNEIKKQYATHYSGQSLDVFLSSIKPGILQSINSATIYPNLAESILFGHETNSFTGATTKPGLLESIKYGVLFLDEIGELPKSLQAKLLRAIDSEIYECSRISGKMDYSLKDIIIISATNQSRKKIRDDFYFKMGIEVELKGIDERPNDVRKAIPHFIRKAIGKRKDYAAVINMFGIKGLQNLNKLSETEEVLNFAKEQSMLVTDDILVRKWPGNFRALRIALEASILRIESPRKVNSFSQEFRNNLHHYSAKYSEDSVKTSIAVGKYFQDSIYPSANPDMDSRILEKINSINTFPNMAESEKNVLAVFLSSRYKTGFRRKDLEEYYKKHDASKHTSEAHIRNKINKLLSIKYLNKTGNGKSTRYHLTKYFLDLVYLKSDDIFSPLNIHTNWIERGAESDSLRKVLMTSERVYIQAPPRYGKSAFIAMFSKTHEKQYNFYYYPLGEAGIIKMFKDMSRVLQTKNNILKTMAVTENSINVIHPFLDQLFKAKGNVKPVLILDNAHYVSYPDGIKTIVELAKKWQEVILILIGDTMDNALLNDFHEFPLGPWGKEA